MRVIVDLPDEIAAELRTNGSDLPRDLLEAYALQAYHTGRITAFQAGKLLGLENPDALASLPQSAAASRGDLAPEAPAPRHDAGRYPLQGTPYTYEDPFGPAAPLDDWEALG